MTLNRDSLKNREDWGAAGVAVPSFDVGRMAAETRESPVWIHFGAGNIFRGYIAALQQRLIESGSASSGIVAAETFDGEIIEKIYKPHDSLTLLVSLMPDGQMKKEIIASIAYGVTAASPDGLTELKRLFAKPSLQMVSYTITEKGYALTDINGKPLPIFAADAKSGPSGARHAMSITAALLLERYNAGAFPIALVSMDNCSHNGEKLQSAVWTVADAWRENGFVCDGFIQYLHDESKVSFPWSMIDKITPRPDAQVQAALTEAGIGGMDVVVTGKSTYIAPFVNAESPQYLVVEDRFPNGRPPLENAGVYMTDRDTVNRTETMKVTTCLNPLHTALAVFGCLLGYERISAEMGDADLKRLVERIGYQEGMPVVVDPGIISPRAFIKEVVEERFPNPLMPDTPQRIATDTSQKIPIRFGETIKRYIASDDLDVSSLECIPLVLAAWARYLLGVGDDGQPMSISPDPMLDMLKSQLAGVEPGNPSSYSGQLRPMLANAHIFGADLVEAGLADKVEGFFIEMLRGQGAVRAALHRVAGERALD
ncbi:MAG: mannitol dehydrogenase family protein [Oscillospiraceae bacterium]|nr:mannitol dehydrogenase family protein [Oscillospiraceae bacterium]